MVYGSYPQDITVSGLTDFSNELPLRPLDFNFFLLLCYISLTIQDRSSPFEERHIDKAS